MAVAGAHVHRDSGEGDAGLRVGQKEGAERSLELRSEQAGVAGAGRSRRRRRWRVVRRGHGRESWAEQNGLFFLKHNLDNAGINFLAYEVRFQLFF
jgi:hypothetical protein